MPPDLSRTTEATHEESLLIEAVSLLVQRQRETETWVAEQVWQAEERANETERRYADLEARLAGIEDQLERLVREVDPGRSEVVDERLARLREQVEGLKSVGDGRSARTGPLPMVDEPPLVRDPEPVATREADSPRPATARGPERESRSTATRDPDSPRPATARDPERESRREPRYGTRDPEPRQAGRAGRPAMAAAQAQGASFLELLGATAQDRWGFVLMLAGAVAVLYAVLTQILR